MKKSDKCKKVFGAIVILAIIVSVFGGVVSAVDLSGGVTQSVTDVEIQAEVGDLSSEDLAEALDAVTDDTANIEFADQSSRSSYDPQAAVIYSDTWWDGRNPSYHDYSSSGGDCANFVSQCLIAGGLDLSVCDSCTWIDDKGCLPRCRDLHTYLVDYLHATWETKPRGQAEPLWFVPGDPAIFGYSDAHPRTHAVFAVTGDATHYARCNAHSSDAHHVLIDDFYNANPSFDRCTFYHVSSDNQPPTASASDISGQPSIMYPDTLYEVTAKYYDPDGRTKGASRNNYINYHLLKLHAR